MIINYVSTVVIVTIYDKVFFTLIKFCRKKIILIFDITVDIILERAALNTGITIAIANG